MKFKVGDRVLVTNALFQQHLVGKIGVIVRIASEDEIKVQFGGNYGICWFSPLSLRKVSGKQKVDIQKQITLEAIKYLEKL